MAKILIKDLGNYKKVYRDTKTGIAWVEDGSTGMGHSAHPNIHHTGSVAGMRKQYADWREARLVHSHGWIYNVDICVVDDDLDRVAANYCRCGGNHQHS